MAAATQSTPSTSGNTGTTEKQEQVMKYLRDHNINDELNIAVNKVCKEMSDDPYGAFVREFQQRAKPAHITMLKSREVLDSRGNPTVEVDVMGMVYGQEKLIARSAAPSGASTGSNEALELRDSENPARYLGKGVTKAVDNVKTKLSNAVAGHPLNDLKALDELLCKADGTPLKVNIGGNAVTATSFALAEAGAQVSNTELFLFLAKCFHSEMPRKFALPRPMFNILNGGKHAGGDLQVQEFMVVPKAGITFKEGLRMICEVYHHLGKILVKKKGPSAKNLGDEGGYAPSLTTPDETLLLIEESIVSAGYKVGEDVFLAMDCAASEYYSKDGKYEIEKGKFFTPEETIQYYLKLAKDHPALISIEDPLDEKDYENWTKLTATFVQEKPGTMVIGDDLYTTNTELIQKGIAGKWANSLLLKVNQIGTINEAMNAARMIYNDNGQVIVSHRSGETTSSLISDLAVAIGAGFIKTGATARGERIAKYNRLLQIEEYLQEHNML